MKAKAATKAKAKKQICMIRSCGRKAYQRGLCKKCLLDALEMIRSGQHTDDELVAAKLILPCKKRGPKPKRLFAAAVAAKCGKKRK